MHIHDGMLDQACPMNREGRWAGIVHLPSGASVPSEGEPATDGRLMTVPLPLGYEGIVN